MTSQDKKDKVLAKLQAPAAPVITAVVRVPDEPKKVGRQKKESSEPLEHLNVYIPQTIALALRMHKAKTRTSMQDILTEALQVYLQSKGELPIK